MPTSVHLFVFSVSVGCFVSVDFSPCNKAHVGSLSKSTQIGQSPSFSQCGPFHHKVDSFSSVVVIPHVSRSAGFWWVGHHFISNLRCVYLLYPVVYEGGQSFAASCPMNYDLTFCPYNTLGYVQLCFERIMDEMS